MGMQVGTATTIGFHTVRDLNAGLQQAQQNEANTPQVQLGQRSQDRSVNPFNQKKDEPERVGFGKGSVSVPTVAVRTIDRNLEAASQLIPTLEETRQRIRERMDQVQQELDNRSQQSPPAVSFDVSLGAPQAASQTGKFLNAVNDAAGAALARAQGQEAPDTTARIDVRIGDASVPFRRQTTSPTVDFLA